MTRRLKVYDNIRFDTEKWFMDADGHMRVPVIIGKAGVLNYTYVDDDGNQTKVREAKLPEEILSKHTQFSAEGKPVTDEHPPNMVDSTNFHLYQKGVFINPKVVDKSIHGEIVIYDKELQDDIKSGRRYQISPGFWSRTEFERGSLDGEEYDAVQRDIAINHIAIVSDGRAGDAVRVKLDSKQVEEIKQEVNKMTEQQKKDFLAKMTDQERKDFLAMTPSDKAKIESYQESKLASESSDADQLNEEPDKEKPETDEDKEEREKKEQAEEEEKKKAEGDKDALPDKFREQMAKLEQENVMLKEQNAKNKGRDSIGAYNQVRDFALRYVTDEALDEYAEDTNYFKRAIVKAAGYESEKMSGGQLDGAYEIAKLMLEQNHTVDHGQKRHDSERKDALAVALKESEEMNSAFAGKRTFKSEVH